MSTTTTFYRTTKYEWTVQEVEVLRTTEHSVFVHNEWRNRAQRNARHSDWCDYWETREAAVSVLRERAQNKLAAAKRTIEEMEAALAILEKEVLP